MPEYKKASDQLEGNFEQVWSDHWEKLPDEIMEVLDDHIDTVEGNNRGKTSSASCTARDGPDAGNGELTIVNDTSESVIIHEIGHMLMDAFGLDCTQEATDRANNKTNYSRWPQFSFGKKDSPVERFMFRRYGDLPELTRHQFTDIESHADRSDVFYIAKKLQPWYEAYTYGPSDDDGHWQVTRNGVRRHQRHEAKSRKDPVVTKQGDPHSFRVRRLDRSVSSIDIKPESQAKVVDRYELTPGLADIIDADTQCDWNGIDRLAYEVNMHWYEAVTLVRKRGDKRTVGQRMSPKGEIKSYYLMNAHEYFAELHSVMMRDATSHIERLEEYCPNLIEAYRNVMFSTR